MVLLAVTLVSTACGARLTAAQLTAANASNNSSSGSGGSGNGSGSKSGPGTTTTVAGTAGSAGSAGSAATGGSATGGAAATGGAPSGTVAAASGPTCPNGAPGSGPGVTPSTITIGNVSTVTGPVPGLFTSARLGTQAFVAYQNSIGGVCGRKLTLDSGDDNMEQAQNSTTVQSLA
ncbi:MAG TPA: ABC transporter substrate-binding protein, partial [Acidimicrobiales bacterium]|nr:ABC transporter substrate-binding protein [Acidimicrobiales bacterium]